MNSVAEHIASTYQPKAKTPTLVCPRCQQVTLSITDTERYSVPAARGAVLSMRTYRCHGCQINVRLLLVSVGEVSKTKTRTAKANGDPPKFMTLERVDDPLVVFKLL